MKMKDLSCRKIAILSVAALCAMCLMVSAYQLLTPITSQGGCYVDIDNNDDISSATRKYAEASGGTHVLGFRIAATVLRFSSEMHPGHYEIAENEGVLHFVHKLKKGMQSPVRVTIPSVRTAERLAAELDKKLMLDSADIIRAFRDPELCSEYGYDTANIVCMFIPNTYEMYWTVSIDKLLARMKKESDAFWTDERCRKAEAAGLTPREVIVLASIVEEETSNEAEKPMIAGLYLNRLHRGMPLQADPTVKFALKQFSLRRIYTKMLQMDSPYNTYRYAGLPPGPIRIPSVSSINAVLNFKLSDYIYMCAKEDFSGTHNFASTLAEHHVNARKYADALNARGVE